MNELTHQQLMEHMVELDTSHKKQHEKKSLEIRCLRKLMKKNETEYYINMTNHCVCHACDETVFNYTHREDEYSESSDTVVNIYKCGICNNNFCKDCVWLCDDDNCKLCDGGVCELNICDGCNEIRKKTDDIRKTVLSYKNN